MPGSPESDKRSDQPKSVRGLHPLAWLLSLALLTTGLMATSSWIDLGIAAALLGVLALRAERRRAGHEAPLLMLAVLVFLVHVVGAGGSWRAAVGSAAAVAFRLLALFYLLRWAARVSLAPIARWLMGWKPPARPRALLLLWESARLTAGLLPLALREAEQHVLALRGRGIRPGRGLGGRARYLLAWFLPFLGTMLRIGDAYADALTVRGYVPGRARRTSPGPGWGAREWGILGGSAGVCVWFLRGIHGI